jgi:hypothetical protein
MTDAEKALVQTEAEMLQTELEAAEKMYEK